MISQSAIHWMTVAVYAVAVAVLVGWLRRFDPQRRRYCYPVVAVVGFAAVMTALAAVGANAIAVGGTQFNVTALVDDLVAYTVLWAVAARLADVSRRTFALVVALPVLQRLAFAVATLAGGVAGLVAVLFVIGGHVALAYLFFGRIWEAAAAVPDEQRLLHWKARNLLLFLIGMLIVYAVLSLGSVFDAFVTSVINQYMNVLIRVGFAGFLFANVDAIALERFDDGYLSSVMPGGNGDGSIVGAD